MTRLFTRVQQGPCPYAPRPSCLSPEISASDASRLRSRAAVSASAHARMPAMATAARGPLRCAVRSGTMRRPAVAPISRCTAFPAPTLPRPASYLPTCSCLRSMRCILSLVSRGSAAREPTNARNPLPPLKRLASSSSVDNIGSGLCAVTTNSGNFAREGESERLQRAVGTGMAKGRRISVCLSLFLSFCPFVSCPLSVCLPV